MLTGKQIGTLAELIEEILPKNPEKPVDLESKIPATDNMQQWEVLLSGAVDRDTSLPAYDEVCEDPIFDELLAYYSSGL